MCCNAIEIESHNINHYLIESRVINSSVYGNRLINHQHWENKRQTSSQAIQAPEIVSFKCPTDKSVVRLCLSDFQFVQ